MKKLITTLTCAALLSVAAFAQVSDYSQLRTNSWSVYGIGGVSGATGDRLYRNVNASHDTYVAPMVGAGVTYNIRPWVRLNLGYEVSKYRREQSWDALQADGLSYRNLEVLYNDVDFTAEFNIAQLFRKKGTSGPFNVYLGTGIGGMFACGYDYTIYVGSSVTSTSDATNDNATMKSWLVADNYYLGRDAAYIPANLSFEYDITPRLTIGAKASGKYILDGNCKLLPTITASVGALVRYNFVGAKHGYTSKCRQISTLRNDLASMTAKAKELTDQNAGLADDLAGEKAKNDGIFSRLDKIEERLSSMEDKMDNCCKGKKSVEYIVYFGNDSAELTDSAIATITEAAAAITSDPDFTTVLTASCSTPGSEAYNKALSNRRAEAVRQALIEKGVSADQISDIVSLGKDGMTNSAECRRVVIDVK